MTISIPPNSNNSVHTLPQKSFKSTSLISTPINILGNAQFVNWSSSGNGSSENPYIIENYHISCNFNANGVSVQNTNKYFVLGNINVVNCIDGFYFSHVMFGSITNSFTVNNSYDGFILTGTSNNNTLMNNVAVNNTYYGFDLNTLSSNNNSANNTSTQNGDGFYVTGSSGNDLSNNIAIQNGIKEYSMDAFGYGFWFLSSSNNTVSNNRATQNTAVGFLLTSSSNNTVSNNLATQSGKSFSLLGASNNTLFHNTAITNEICDFCLATYAYYPISPIGSSHNTLSINLATQNNDGFDIFSSSYNKFLNNSVTYNNFYGFYLDSSSNNTLISNTGNNNKVYDCYELDSPNNIFTNNIFGISATSNAVTTITTSVSYSGSTNAYIVGLILLGVIILVGLSAEPSASPQKL